ncbi:hypothetical protein DFJ73DRAFT_854498 [Zopfochytrium polystomum]|nr:hypothetical protein DFJ73DRAFT_854498 [Zopfochytrium polystomum]
MTQQERARKRLREEAAEEAKRARRKRDEDERRVETAVAGTAEAVRKPDARHRDKAAPLAFVVWTSCGYRPDGWHSYDGPPPKEFDSSFATKKEANDRVRYRFYAKNTWGLGVREMMEQEVEEKERGGLLTLSTTPPDSECWTVAAVPAEAFQFLSDVDEDDGGGSDDIRYDDDDGPSDDDDDGGGGVGGRRRYDFLL